MGLTGAAKLQPRNDGALAKRASRLDLKDLEAAPSADISREARSYNSSGLLKYVYLAKTVNDDPQIVRSLRCQMPEPTQRSRLARMGFYFAVVLAVLIVWQIQRYMNLKSFGPGVIIASSSSSTPSASDQMGLQWDQMGLQVVSEKDSLLTTLGTAMMGALGFLLVGGPRTRTRPRHQWSAFVSALCVGVSLYFGYVSHLHVLWMIKSQTFDPYSALYLLPSQGQFYALLF